MASQSAAAEEAAEEDFYSLLGVVSGCDAVCEQTLAVFHRAVAALAKCMVEEPEHSRCRRRYLACRRLRPRDRDSVARVQYTLHSFPRHRSRHASLPQSPLADGKEIKAAYYRMVRTCHPDRTGDDEATDFCAMLNEVYEVRQRGLAGEPSMLDG